MSALTARPMPLCEWLLWPLLRLTDTCGQWLACNVTCRLDLALHAILWSWPVCVGQQNMVFLIWPQIYSAQSIQLGLLPEGELAARLLLSILLLVLSPPQVLPHCGSFMHLFPGSAACISNLCQSHATDVPSQLQSAPGTCLTTIKPQ